MSCMQYVDVNGLWFPSWATRIVRSGQTEFSLEFTATNFKIVEDSKDLYEVKLKPGTHVIDKIVNTKFTVGDR